MTYLLFLKVKWLKRPKLRVYLLTSVARNSSVVAANNSVLDWSSQVDTGYYFIVRSPKKRKALKL